MKTVYFIRHGKSDSNLGPIRKGGNSSLIKEGEDQVSTSALLLKNIPIEITISSTFNQARQTTEIISKEIGVDVEYSDLFVERKRPSEQLNVEKNDPASIEAERVIRNNFYKEGFRFSDEENFSDLKNRAKEAIEFLKNRKESDILVVTHGFFMRIVAAYVIFGDKLRGEECERFIQALRMNNCGINVLTIDGEEMILKSWNNYLHL